MGNVSAQAVQLFYLPLIAVVEDLHGIVDSVKEPRGPSFESERQSVKQGRTEPSFMSKDKPVQILQTSFDRRTRSHTYAAWTSTIRWGSKRKWADNDPILETRSASTPNGALGSGRTRKRGPRPTGPDRDDRNVA